ncbi:MAG TPA: glucose-6-phosphate dehydrogenase assembly protein OpcA [Solirubrobacteraceae bacterium]|nr:glucose-6-phosphate dehydrogenase assembly protein OpcA [Solirubrobacteraceae bacterium]
MPAISDAAWSKEGTTPDAIEAALRELLARRAKDSPHAEHRGLVPARVLNMIVFVESRFGEETAERLRGVGRYHASRTVILSYEPDRERLDARVTVSSEGDPGRGELALLRETVLVEIGKHHLDDLTTIADPLVVSDLPTLLWSPHGHPQAADALLGLAQTALIDSTDAPDRLRIGWREAIERACALSEQVYVVDLAWLRSTPWRERVAATFDPPRMRPELDTLSAVTISHHRDSTIAAMLLVGWLASRLGWELDRSALGRAATDGELRGRATAGGRDIDLCLQATPELQAPGLEGLELRSESGLRVRLDRGPGGLRAHRRWPTTGFAGGGAVRRHGAERAWTLLGASRGEGGILGEGIRQSLLRDPTYTPALHAAHAMLP